MVVLDIRNSRMKDFYDIWFMANTWSFNMSSLRRAIAIAFERRRSTLPGAAPFALTDEFLTDPDKVRQWKAFMRRLGPANKSPSLQQVGEVLRAFLLPCISEPLSTSDNVDWKPNAGWVTNKHI